MGRENKKDITSLCIGNTIAFFVEEREKDSAREMMDEP
jgi:hypothetical protein